MGDVTDDEVDSKDNDGGEASSSKTSTHTPAVVSRECPQRKRMLAPKASFSRALFCFTLCCLCLLFYPDLNVGYLIIDC